MAAATAETARVEAPVVALAQSAAGNPFPPASIPAVTVPATGMVKATALVDPAGMQMLTATFGETFGVPETEEKSPQHEPAVEQTVAPVVVQPEARSATLDILKGFFFFKSD